MIFDGDVANHLGSWLAGHNARKMSYSFADWCNNPLACIDSHICTRINTISLIKEKDN